MSINIINIVQTALWRANGLHMGCCVKWAIFFTSLQVKLDLATAKESDIFLTILQQNKTLSVIFTLLSYKWQTYSQRRNEWGRKWHWTYKVTSIRVILSSIFTVMTGPSLYWQDMLMHLTVENTLSCFLFDC